MDNTRLRHDTAMALSKAILDIFQNLLRPEEYKEAHEMTYTAVKASLEYYDLHRERMLKRLKPLEN